MLPRQHPMSDFCNFLFRAISGLLEPVPRKHALPTHEIEVGRRLREIRLQRKCPRSYLAHTVGVGKSVITRIELGRAPLRFWLGWKICRELNISQVWLVTGRGSMTPFLQVDLVQSQAHFDEHYLFYEVCTGALREQLNQRAMGVEAFRDAYKDVPTSMPPVDEITIRGWRNKILRLRDAAFGMNREADELERKIALAGISNRGERDQHHTPETKSKLFVDTLPDSAKVTGVNSETGYWKALVEKVRAKTSGPGAKARLAREFSTTRQAVNKWLSGKGAPSAEITLRLQAWVSQQEQTPKTPGSVISTAKGKTQPRSSKAYEKTKSNPHKG